MPQSIHPRQNQQQKDSQTQIPHSYYQLNKADSYD